MSDQSQKTSVFASKTVLPEEVLTKRSGTLLGFTDRYTRIRDRLRLIFRLAELPKWSKKHHREVIPLCDLIAEQYPLIIFHGDVGTGKTVTAEGVANSMVAEAGEAADESLLFKLSTRVRGSGKVGEMGTLLNEAFAEVIKSAGKTRHAILIIDEGDSLASKRSQEHSHHEDKVAVNTLIQNIDDLSRFNGRVLVILCTNRLSVLDPAILRRAAVKEEFLRPSTEERTDLFNLDLSDLGLTKADVTALVDATGTCKKRNVPWTYSDIRLRLYP